MNRYAVSNSQLFALAGVLAEKAKGFYASRSSLERKLLLHNGLAVNKMNKKGLMQEKAFMTSLFTDVTATLQCHEENKTSFSWWVRWCVSVPFFH